MATAKTKTAAARRREEVRRSVPRPRPPWLESLRRREAAWACFFAAMLLILGSLIAIPSRQVFPYRQGQVVSEPVVSRGEFLAVSQAKLEEARQKAAAAVAPVYLPNEELLESVRRAFGRLIELARTEDISEVPSEVREQYQLTEAALEQLRQYAEGEDGKSLEQWKEQTRGFSADLFSLAVLDPQTYAEQSAQRITIMHPAPGSPEQAEQTREPVVIYSLEDTEAIRKKLQTEAQRFPPALRESVIATVMQQLEADRPTYERTDEAIAMTERRRELAAEEAQVEPDHYAANEVLVDAGQTLETSDIDVLEAERETFLAQQSLLERWLVRAGVSGIVALIAAGVWLYIWHYNERIVRNPMRGLAITLLLLLCQGLAAGLTRLHPDFLYVTAIFPILLASMALTIVYDRRFAAAVGTMLTALVVISLRLPVALALVPLAGVGTAALLLREVRTRSTVVMVGLWSGLAMAVVALAAGLASRPLHVPDELNRLLADAGTALVTGFVTGLFVQGILPVIEKLFKVSTAMTLKELNDASHPLLQRLAQEAPGTYQHSLRIGDMAEAAAESIGADGLLCRVGSMYHDIGKINKPMYFIENQGGGPNRHNRLSPAMSLLIILGHVKDGVEMAREYRLPPAVKHFIESHHGTTLVEYFYEAAKRQKEAEEAPLPSEFEFRYPGPKPQTKEAGILMLADGIEAAARSLDEPTPVRLEQLVHRIANKRLMDGQFDECHLTLAELHRIEQALTKTLCAIHHGRCKYPASTAPAPPAPGEQPTVERTGQAV